jgi:hypothetical protein
MDERTAQQTFDQPKAPATRWRFGLVMFVALSQSPIGFEARTTASETGRIGGTIAKPALATAVTAIDRTSGKTDKKYPGKLDAQTGRFVIEGLPLGATYDVVIDVTGARLEGINLKVSPSDFEEEQPLTKEDIAALKAQAVALNKFEDHIEVLAVTGNTQHAAVVLNKLRTKPFYESKPGEVIWRLELWHFERPEETWVKDQEELFLVFYRERIQKSVYDKKSITLDPALGGHKLMGKMASVDLGLIKLPSTEPGIRLRQSKREDQP